MLSFYLDRKKARDARLNTLMREAGVTETSTPKEINAVLRRCPPVDEFEAEFVVSWVYFPQFIATDVLMHKRLQEAWEERWRGEIPSDLEMDPDNETVRQIHEWVCDWIAQQYPAFTRLDEYLFSMIEIDQVG